MCNHEWTVRGGDEIMSLLDNLEGRIDALVRGWTARLLGSPTDPNVIEIRHAVLDEIDRAVEPVGRGEKSFPFDRIVLRVATSDLRRRTLLETAFRDRRFLDEVRARVRKAGAEPPSRITLEVEVTDAPGEDWADRRYALELTVGSSAPGSSSVSQSEGAGSRSLLRVTRGRASQRRYPIGTRRINIGRTEDVVDEDGRLERRNDVVFQDDADEINLTVSRSHAHLSYEPETRSWRIADDGSGYGTRVFREGRSIDVPRGPRGVRLQNGDHIFCGQACLDFESRD